MCHGQWQRTLAYSTTAFRPKQHHPISCSARRICVSRPVDSDAGQRSVVQCDQATAPDHGAHHRALEAALPGVVPRKNSISMEWTSRVTLLHSHRPQARLGETGMVSSPTAGALLSCRFAIDYLTQNYRRNPNGNGRQPCSRVHFGAVPNVAAPRWSSKDLLRPSSSFGLRPGSPESRHETPITISL
jgi:hypothetical protein